MISEQAVELDGTDGASGSSALLSVDAVSKRFIGRKSALASLRRGSSPVLTALDGVTLEVAPQRIVGVVGESGSGKSTLAKCIVRLIDPDSGSIRFLGEDVGRARGRALVDFRRAVQLIYQDPYASLNPMMSVVDAVAEPAWVHGLIDRRDRREWGVEMLDTVGLSASVANRRPRELSGGQRQRVAIARSMAVDPRLLIADEAVSALDMSVQAQVLNLFEKLREDKQVAILFIAHQLSVVAHLADEVVVMYLGAVVESGPVDDVFASPAHPYTAALLAAQPGRHRRGRRAPALMGELPSPTDMPSGCRFRTRCPMAQDICAQVAPPTVRVSEQRSAMCHFAV